MTFKSLQITFKSSQEKSRSINQKRKKEKIKKRKENEIILYGKLILLVGLPIAESLFEFKDFLSDILF